MATDPVCGMQVDESRAAGRAEHGGRSYYFCSTSCLGKFRAAPAAYAAGAVAAGAHAHGEHAGHGDGGIEGVAAAFEYLAPDLRGQRVGAGDGGVGCPGGCSASKRNEKQKNAA